MDENLFCARLDSHGLAAGERVKVAIEVRAAGGTPSACRSGSGVF
jgi:hypothetical protein